jgi:hypothetical protein
MQLRVWKQFYISPFVRLNLYTTGVHRKLRSSPDRLDFFRQARDSGDTANGYPPGAYLTESRIWDKLGKQK